LITFGFAVLEEARSAPAGAPDASYPRP